MVPSAQYRPIPKSGWGIEYLNNEMSRMIASKSEKGMEVWYYVPDERAWNRLSHKIVADTNQAWWFHNAALYVNQEHYRHPPDVARLIRIGDQVSGRARIAGRLHAFASSTTDPAVLYRGRNGSCEIVWLRHTSVQDIRKSRLPSIYFTCTNAKDADVRRAVVARIEEVLPRGVEVFLGISEDRTLWYSGTTPMFDPFVDASPAEILADARKHGLREAYLERADTRQRRSR